MKITAVTPQKKRGRYNVDVEGEFYVGLSERSIAKFNLYPDKEISDSDLKEVFCEELIGRLYDRCIGKLSRRPQSRREIERYCTQVVWKKKRQWFAKSKYESESDLISEKVIQKVIERLEDQKLLSDNAFSEWWVEQRLRSGRGGWKLIQSELYSKGVDRDVVESVKPNVKDELASARIAYQKQCKKSVPREKCIERLARRGFGWSIIEQVIPKEQ